MSQDAEVSTGLKCVTCIYRYHGMHGVWLHRRANHGWDLPADIAWAALHAK